MVCHLSGTAQLGELTSTSASKWHDWHDRGRRGEIDWVENSPDDPGVPVRRPRIGCDQPPVDRVADAKELFRRLSLRSARIESGCGRILDITSQQQQSFERLHGLRNSFTHFSPRGWSIEVQLIKDTLLDVLDILALIADDCWPFRHMTGEERNALQIRIYELRHQVSDIARDTPRI